MTNQFATPLTTLATSARKDKAEIKVGDLITVELFGGKISGARVTRIAYGTFFVTLAALQVPAPYSIGQALALDESKVIDW